MLIDEAYKMLLGAKGGNELSKDLFNGYAKEHGLGEYSDDDASYSGITDYNDFYMYVYYHTMLD